MGKRDNNVHPLGVRKMSTYWCFWQGKPCGLTNTCKTVGCYYKKDERYTGLASDIEEQERMRIRREQANESGKAD